MADFQDQPSSVRAGEELDTAKLEPFLRANFSDENGPLRIQQFPSGHSNLTYSVRIGSRQFVLRRPPFGANVKSAHDMGREFRVLSQLHAVYPAAPQVILSCDDLSVLGAPFYLMEPIKGVILRKDPPADLKFPALTARRLSEAFLDNLVRLHNLDYAAIGLGDLGRPEGYLERQVRGWTERYSRSQTHDFPEVKEVTRWMKEHMPSGCDAAVIHNDYKYDNVVLNSDDITEIVGVLDWEMATIGDPLSDLGTALAYWVDADDPQELKEVRWGPTTYPGSMTRQELAERYAQKTARHITSMDFYLVFARFKVAVIIQQIYYRYRLGLTTDERFASMPRLTTVLLRASLRAAEAGKV
jgi:aminoglycoside phosphotransferase (APT) family kinase protein